MTLSEKLQSLIDAANSATTLSDNNMTDAVESLISGYGKGGGKTATVTITAPTGSIVTLTDGIETLTTSEIAGVWTFANVPYGIWTVVVITGVTTQSKDLTVVGDVSEVFYNLVQVVNMPGNSLINEITDYPISSEGGGFLQAGITGVGEENPGGCFNITTKSLYGYIAEENGFNKFLFRCRAKISNFNTEGCLFGMYNLNGAGINFYVNQSGVYVKRGFNRQASHIINAYYTVTQNAWHTFEFAYEDNKCSVIVDGVKLIDSIVPIGSFSGSWTALKINNCLLDRIWINNHSSASYLSMNIEKIELLCL